MTTPFAPPLVKARSHKPQGLGYDALLDPNLTECVAAPAPAGCPPLTRRMHHPPCRFLRSKPVFQHLRKQRLVTDTGRIVDDSSHNQWCARVPGGSAEPPHRLMP
jgi:hypothetical protein